MKFGKKIITLGLTIALIIPAVKVNATNNNLENINEEVINKIETNITYSDKGITIDSEKELKEDLKQIDINSIKQELINLGANKQEVSKFNENTIFKLVKDNIEDINKDVKQNKLKIVENHDIINADDDNFYVQGGSTYSKRYSWGVRHYKSTAAANRFTYELNKKSNNIGLTAGLSFVFAPYGIPGGILGTVTAWYLSGMSNEVNYYNNKNNRGIILDINNWLTYSVRNQ